MISPATSPTACEATGCSESAAAKRGGHSGPASRQSWSRSRTEPDHAVRGMRRAIGVRDGRRSSTVTGTSATEPGAVGAQHELGVEEIGAVAAATRRSARPSRAASPSCRGCPTRVSPNPIRSTDEKPAVIARRGHGRVSLRARRTLGADHDRGTAGGGERGEDLVDERGVVVVDVEHDDHVVPAAARIPARIASP